MTLIQIQYFLTVASTGNLSKAAQMLFTTPSNVSKYISQLEKELNYQLFHRGNHGVFLTEEGQRFRNCIEQSYHAITESIQQATSFTANRIVRIAISQDQQLSPILLQALRRQNLSASDHRVCVMRDSDQLMVSRLLSMEYDMIITNAPYVESSQVQCWHLFSLESVLAFSVRHPMAGKADLCLRDFSEDYFLVPLHENTYGLRKSEVFIREKYGFSPKFLYAGDTGSCLLNATIGLGVAILPKIYVSPDMLQLSTIPVFSFEPQWCNLLLRTNESSADVLAAAAQIRHAYGFTDPDFKADR